MCAVGVLSILLGSAAARAADWPTYRHDNHRSGATNESLQVERLGRAWVYRAAQPPQPAWPAPAKWDAYAGIRGLRSMRNFDPVYYTTVVGDALYYGSSADDAVHCLDMASGSERWAYFTNGPVRIPPTVVDGKLYFGSDDGFAYCVDAQSGELIWKFSPSQSEPSRLVLNNGRFIPFWPCRSGVMVEGDTAYFACALLPWKAAFLCAVDKETGRPEGAGRFVRTLRGVTFEGTLLASEDFIFAPQGRVPPLVFRRRNGHRMGTLKGGGGCFVLVTPDNHVLHGPGNKTGWITDSDAKTRAKVATYQDGNAMVVVGGTAYMLTDETLFAVDRKSREQRWNVTTHTPYSLIYAGGVLFSGGHDRVVALAADNGRQLWSAPVEGRAYGLAVANGALLVSTDEGHIYCFRATDQPQQATARAAAPATTAADDSQAELPPVAEIDDAGLLGRWLFRPDLLEGNTLNDLAGEQPASISGPIRFDRRPELPAIELRGKTTISVAKSAAEATLPQEAIAAEAWLRIDQPVPSGGIIGVIQDNKDDQHGWLLGYREMRFCFALRGQQGAERLTYLLTPVDYEVGRWYHVAATYDGSTMKLYVNGRLMASSQDQRGAIDYPSEAFFEIGAFHDKDESVRMQGALHEVRLYRRALTADEVAAHFHEKPAVRADRDEIVVGPYLQFVAPGEAVVRYRTANPMPTIVEYGLRRCDRKFEDAAPKTEHMARLTGLRRNAVHHYTVVVDTPRGPARTVEFECDTHFDFSLLPVGSSRAASRASQSGHKSGDETPAAEAARLIKLVGPGPGICVLYGLADQGQLAYQLAAQSLLRVVAIDTDPKRISAARQWLAEQGAYGTRAAVLQVERLDRLPITGHVANLVVVADPATADADEVLRILRPGGGRAVVRASEPALAERWKNAVASAPAADWAPYAFESQPDGFDIVRGRVRDAGAWSHLYGHPDNSAFSRETLSGATAIDALDVQWLGRPGPRAQPDRNGRKPSPLAINGRLFAQGLHRLIALDAYNGSILWSLEIPQLERFNMPRDCGNWCADDHYVYAAIRGHCWKIDAATGQVVAFFQPPVPAENNTADQRYEWGYVARYGDKLLGSAVREGAIYTTFWGGRGAGWYDAVSGPITDKVCSENLFALDPDSGKRLWTYSDGVTVDSTITVADNRVFLLECRNPEVLAARARRVGEPLWKDLWLVCLDVESGSRVWQRPMKNIVGETVVYLAHGEGHLVLLTSGTGKYRIYGLDPKDGSELWQNGFDWWKDNHGAHMMRPAIVRGRIYVRPHIFDLASGKMFDKKMPPGHGCGTYACTTDALVFRAGNLTVWDYASGKATRWSRLRPDCWLSTVPGCGMLLSPEGGGGCSCGSWMETSIGFIPKRLVAEVAN